MPLLIVPELAFLTTLEAGLTIFSVRGRFPLVDRCGTRREQRCWMV